MNRWTAFAVVGFMLLAGCAPTPAPVVDTRDADAKAIKDDEAAWNKDWADKNLDKVLSHYADDASLEISDTPLLKKDGMRMALQQVLADPNWSISFSNDVVDVSKAGDLAYVQGHYTLTASDQKTKKKVTEKGKYVTVYKKQADGSWKAVQDINNADAPAA